MIKLIDNGVTHLLWTGGWDSTFRLLQLVIIQKKTVQPHYVMDPSRRSYSEELHAMAKIKRAIWKRFPETRSLLCPTIITDINDVPANADITNTYNHVLERQVLGTQYEWLARYAKSTGIPRLELGINRGHNPARLIDAYLSYSGEGYDEISWIDDIHQDTDAYKIFGYYIFPLRTIPKIQMGNVCRQHGIFDILNMSWFCHSPLPNHTPCGICSPCTSYIELDQAERVPLIGRINYYLSPKKNKQRIMTAYYKLTRTHLNRVESTDGYIIR